MPSKNAPIRIQKYLSQRGICSRRRAEEYILQGRITLNGTVVHELGTHITPGKDKLTVDGKPVHHTQTKVTTVALFKPRDVITSLHDPQQRPIISDLLPKSLPRLWPIGRLDWNSEGLVLMTNDGDLTHALTHPSKHIDKTYTVKVQGQITTKDPGIAMMRRGLTLDDGFVTSSCEVIPIRTTASSTWLQITLHEGHNRQIRRMCEAVGYRVQRLRRISIGNITLDPLRTGQWRPLTAEEILTLYQLAGLPIPPFTRAKDIARDMIAAMPQADEEPEHNPKERPSKHHRSKHKRSNDRRNDRRDDTRDDRRNDTRSSNRRDGKRDDRRSDDTRSNSRRPSNRRSSNDRRSDNDDRRSNNRRSSNNTRSSTKGQRSSKSQRNTNNRPKTSRKQR